MATYNIPPPPQFRDDFSDYDIDARLEELNSNPIYQPPGHWLRELPFLDEIVNTDIAKYLHPELKKRPYSLIATNVFGVVRVVQGWYNRKHFTRFEYSTRMNPSVSLKNNNIPYGRVHHCVIPSRLEGRIDVKWSTFHSLKKQELINKVRSVKGEGGNPELFLKVCRKKNIKELIRELIQT